jgi:hypothetical protein
MTPSTVLVVEDADLRELFELGAVDEPAALDELGPLAISDAGRSFTIPDDEAFTCVGPTPTSSSLSLHSRASKTLRARR